MSAGTGFVADDLSLFRIVKLAGFVLLNIDGNIDQYRTGTPGSGDVKRLLENPGQVRRVFHQVRMFGKRLAGAGDVHLLEHIPA